MMNLDTWRKLHESIGGGMTLGISKPHTVGGLMGLHREWDDEDDEDDEDDGGDSESDSDEGDDGKEGDLIGSSDEDEGPDKSFPPENSEDDGELPFGQPDDPTAGGSEMGEDEDDDFLASIGAGGGGHDMGGDDAFGGLDDLAGMGGAEAPEGGMGGDMDFLGDINPELLGGDFEGDDAGGMGHVPCPECNPNGDDVGDPDCQCCAGEGFCDPNGNPDASVGPELTGGDDLDAAMAGAEDAPDHEEMAGYMNKMLSYMKKYMKKEATQFSEFAPAIAGAAARALPAMGQMASRAAASPMVQNMAGQAASGAASSAVNNMMQQPQQQQPAQQQQQMMRKKMVKFMTKGGERSFMAADAPRKFMKKDADRKNCHCETTDFLNSLCKSAKGNNCKNSTGITEDALLKAIDPEYEYEEPRAGQAGFAPQGRVGGVGGGYTKKDFADLPVLGESRRYPTLAEYAAYRNRAAKRRG